MANPVVTAVTKGGWVKVATNVIDVTVIPLQPRSHYTWTYRLTGVAAPTTAPEAALLPASGLSLCATAAIDVYVWCTNIDGIVRVDEGLALTYLIDG